MIRFKYSAAVALILACAPIHSANAATDWKEVGQAIGIQGSMQPDGVYKIGLPRTDLKVKVDGITVKPALALGGWLAFKEEGDSDMVMGDLVLAQEEISPVMQQLTADGFEVTALHNHLLRAVPFPMYMHVSGHGDPVALAKKLHEALALTHTPLTEAKKSPPEKLDFDTKQLDGIMGSQGKTSGGVYKFSVPRKVKVSDDGMEIPASMGMTSAIGFQPVGKDKAAVHGDLILLATEVTPVLRVLQENKIEVTALHNHMLTEEPHLFFMHFWAVDNPEKLARGLRAALDKTDTQKP